MSANTSMFRMEDSSVRSGERLAVDLELPFDAPWRTKVARVELCLQGRVEERSGDGTPSPWPLTRGARAHHEGPSAGLPRLRFTLEVPHGLPPSHAGPKVHILWELVARVSDARGRLLHQEARAVRLAPATTRQGPVSRELPPPVARWDGRALLRGLAVAGPLLLMTLPSGVLPFVALRAARGRPVDQLLYISFILLCSLSIGGMGVWMSWEIARHLRVVGAASRGRGWLRPLTERVPLGATARLRLFLELPAPLCVQRARFFLRCDLTRGRRRQEVLTHDGPVSVPAQLSAGRHALDVEVPVPRDFIPDDGKRLATTCTVVLVTDTLQGVSCSTALLIAPEVLEADAA